MASSKDEKSSEDETKAELMARTTSSGMKLVDYIPIYVPAMEKGLLLNSTRKKKRFLDFLKAKPSKDWYLKFGFIGRLSPFSFLRRTSTQNGSGSSSGGGGGSSSYQDFISGFSRRRFRVPFARKINWPALKRYCKKWVKEPMNIALLVWLFFVVIGIVILFLLMTGLLDETIPSKQRRDRWTEVTNQILNALFTIMCVYQHPRLFHHLILLLRWRPDDITELRSIYCKTSGRKPHEWAHLMLVIFLLHLTCLDQYALCALYWGFSSKTRPDWSVNALMGLGIAAPIIAGLYIVYSPLGKKYESVTETDEESLRQQVAMTTAPVEGHELKLNNQRLVIITSPEWVGGLFDCWDDMTVAYLSFFCTFCVFGWNMERLGFGNMYVHIITFILLCVAPFWIFSVAALNINVEAVKIATVVAGVLLCFLGLFYGGFWRMQMRKKYKLPANPFCFNSAAVTEFLQWLFCWSCALAQEVRTANFYDVEDDSFCRREVEEDGRPAELAPLPREGGVGPFDRLSYDLKVLSYPNSEESEKSSRENSTEDNEQVMAPPIPPLIHQVVDKL